MRVLFVMCGERSRPVRALLADLARLHPTLSQLPAERLTRQALAETDVALVYSGRLSQDSMAVCRKIRATSSVATIFVLDQAGPCDRSLGLGAGADDCVVAPFDPAELADRMRGAFLRRHPRERLASSVGRASGISIDFTRMTATVGSSTTTLTKKEFQLLAVIVAAGGKVCGKEQLSQALWGRPEREVSNSLQVLIYQLRAKIGYGRIKTVRGAGYQLVDLSAPDRPGAAHPTDRRAGWPETAKRRDRVQAQN
jgi:DNA-binding response OmpR family regulator